ncbi:hypothetical protein SNE40_000729 [Patella caerulea]|uniref:Uncharacterized protein n=1 Tax=Patella caerulea TaxID=87958 RepID=A0AAN8KFG1_PATCE
METRIWVLLFFSGFCFSQTPPNDAPSETLLQGTGAPATTASTPPRNTDPLGLLDNYQPQVTSSVLKFIAEIQTRSLENAITIQAQLNDLAYSQTPLIPDPRYFDASRSRVKRQATSDDETLPEDLLRILGRDSVDQTTQREPPRQPGTVNPPPGLPRPDPNNRQPLRPSAGLFRQPGGIDPSVRLPRPGPINGGQISTSGFYPGPDPRYERPSGENPIVNQSPPPQYLRGPAQPLPFQSYPSDQNSGGAQTGERNTGDNGKDQNAPINRTPTLIRIHPRRPASDNGQQNPAATLQAPNGQILSQPPRNGLTQGGIQRAPTFNPAQSRTPTLNGQPSTGRPTSPILGNPPPTNFGGPAIPPARSDGQRRPIPASDNRQPNRPPVNFRGPPFRQPATGQQGRLEPPIYNGQTNIRPVNFRGPSFQPPVPLQQRRPQPPTNNEQSNGQPINFRGPPSPGQQERPFTPTNNGQQNRQPINFIRPPGSGQQEIPSPPRNNGPFIPNTSNNRVINTPVWRLPLYRYPNRGITNNTSVPGPTYVPQIVNWSDPRNRPAAENNYNRYRPTISPYTPGDLNLADWFDQYDRQLDPSEDQQSNQPSFYPNNIGQPDRTYPSYNQNYPYNQNPNSRYPYSPEYGYGYPYNGAYQQPRPSPYPGATPNRYPNNPNYGRTPSYNSENVPIRQSFANPGAGPTRPNTPYNRPPYTRPLQPSTPYIQRPEPNRLSPVGQTPSNQIRPFPSTLTRSDTRSSRPNDQAGSNRIGQPPALRAVAGEEEHDEPYQNVLQNLNRYRNLIPTLRAVGQGTSGQQQQEPSYVKALAVLRSFIPGETFVYNGYIVQNFYIYGDYEMAKEHFRSLPNVNVTYSNTDKYSGYTGTIQNYRVTLCEACGLGQRYPVIEIVGLAKVYPGVVKRFLYSPSYDPMVDPMINPLNTPTGAVPTVPPE